MSGSPASVSGRPSGGFLGWFHLRPRNPDGVIDLGYRLRRQSWGHGLATEGSRALIDKGFGELDMERIVAGTMAANQGSRRVMEKCGMTLARTYPWDGTASIEGSELGCVEYVLTRADWLAASSSAPRRPASDDAR